MRILRFRCGGCGLDMALPEKPEKCSCCESSNITRQGWRMRVSQKKGKE